MQDDKMAVKLKGIYKKKKTTKKIGMLRFCNEHIYLIFNILLIIVIVVIYN